MSPARYSSCGPASLFQPLGEKSRAAIRIDKKFPGSGHLSNESAERFRGAVVDLAESARFRIGAKSGRAGARMSLGPETFQRIVDRIVGEQAAGNVHHLTRIRAAKTDGGRINMHGDAIAVTIVAR